jgi:nicotinamidase-related amidase
MAAKPIYDPARTGLLFVDPYNDFLSEGGKVWPRVKEVAEQVGLLDNLKAVVNTVRKKSIKVFIVPHHRWEPGDYIKKMASPYPLPAGRGRAAKLRQGHLGRHVPRRLPAAARRHRRA